MIIDSNGSNLVEGVQGSTHHKNSNNTRVFCEGFRLKTRMMLPRRQGSMLGNRAVFAVAVMSAIALACMAASVRTGGSKGGRSKHSVGPGDSISSGDAADLSKHSVGPGDSISSGDAADLGHVHAHGGGRTPETSVFAFGWEDVAPELAEVAQELSSCADSAVEILGQMDVAKLFACDVPGNDDGSGSADDDPFAQRCQEERDRHYQAVVKPSSDILSRYKEEEVLEVAAAKAQKGRTCGWRERDVGNRGVGDNATFVMRDRWPCRGPQRYVSQLLSSNRRGLHQGGGIADDDAGRVFAQGGGLSGRLRLDHVASRVRRKKEPTGADAHLPGWVTGGPCGRRVQGAVARMAGEHKGMLSQGVSDSFRGLFWYPPGGFDSWHTDGNLVQGWRIYLISVVGQGNGGSFFAYQDPVTGEFQRVNDAKGQVNMFKVSASTSVWHAVASESDHRFSVGLAITDEFAAVLLKRLEQRQAKAST